MADQHGLGGEQPDQVQIIDLARRQFDGMGHQVRAPTGARRRSARRIALVGRKAEAAAR